MTITRFSVITAASAALIVVLGLHAQAADHLEAPGAVADPVADIADLYAWHGDDVLTTVLTFNGASAASADATYDEDVLYGIHIDTDGDVNNGAELEVWARFGQNALGEWGVQVLNLPGADGAVAGPVQSTIAQGSVRVWTGLADDPFFFDQGGFATTVSSGDLSFDGSDDIAGANATGIVLEMDLADDVFGDATTLQVWATTARL